MRTIEILYLGKKTEVTGQPLTYEGNPDFCIRSVSTDQKNITHKLELNEFTTIEKLVLIELKK